MTLLHLYWGMPPKLWHYEIISSYFMNKDWLHMVKFKSMLIFKQMSGP